MGKKVKTIEPVRQKVLQELRPKKRVCAYCRVSTDSAKQHTSYAAQTKYYKEYIESQAEWKFVGIFADESSGTKVKNRDEFQRMVTECEKENIDLIITKSITRFARNTIDSIETIRMLKSFGIAVYFEKENINTMTEQSEQMLTILSSIAQGESESISTNTRWGIQKRFGDGSYIPSSIAYGYAKDENGELIIKEDEAEIIRRIYNEYLSGKGSYAIARDLTRDNIPTIRTAEKWHDGVVKGILQNPIYKGELLLQKTYTTDMLPFTKKINHGELPMYFVKDSHEPIITQEQAERVREIYEYRRVQVGMDDSGKCQNRYEFSSKIICKECGGTFRRQKMYVGKPYEKIQWCCITHIENRKKCSMKAVREDIIKDAFLTMWNKLVSNYSEILYPLLESLKKLRVNKEQEEEILKLNNNISELMEQSHILQRVMIKGYMDSADFMEKQNTINIEIEEYKKKRNVFLERNGYEKEIDGTKRILQIIKYNPIIMDDYQEELFIHTVDKVLIGKSGDITFRLINNLELTEYITKR
ncbi:MAG: recombinase family protein [Anaerovorax sp.]|nr:recombinase family protein [Anaerovorax sp.]